MPEPLTTPPASTQPPVSNNIIETEFGKMLQTPIIEEMERSYLDYAMSVIVSRALPDVRDGLKPVHRRILFVMRMMGMHYNTPYKKSARIVGEVLGKFHPHGDTAVYDALVRLAQNFSMRYPLVDGQGNFGSIDGDSPAAMRYTEARMSKISEDLLVDIEKKTVDFVDNFDGSQQEPTVLPAKLPNLLLMGAEGIAVGMATKIPPHNLEEVCRAILDMIEQFPGDQAQLGTPEKTKDVATTKTNDPQTLLAADPHTLAGHFNSEITIDQIMTHIKGPDFPTAGVIYDWTEIMVGYSTGRGKVVIRGVAEIEENKNGKFQIIITQLPYQVNKAKLVAKIAYLVREKKLIGISDLRDESDRSGLRVVVDLKRDAKPKSVLNNLFKQTELQSSFPMNMVALNSEGTPQLMSIKTILTEYVKHRQLVIVRRAQFELKAACDRAHILEGLLIALAHLDEVIKTIRESPDSDTAKARLMERFKLSELQSVAILDMQLRRLAALERQKIEDEYKTIQKTISDLCVLLSSTKAILTKISTEVTELITNYSDKRRTKLIKSKVGVLSEEDLIPNEETVITLTQTGYVKRQRPDSLRTQNRGGTGSSGITTREEDTVKSIITAQTHDSLLFFTNKGRTFKLKVYEITESSRQAKGTAVVNLVNLKPDEKVQALLVLNEKTAHDKFITLATRQGLVKKTAVKLYENIRQNGIIAIALKDDDELVFGTITTGNDHIMLITRSGKSIRFSEKEVKSSNRDTQGVKGIELKGSDYVVGVEAFGEQDEAQDTKNKAFHQLLLIAENGIGKRTKLDQYPVQKRSGQGVKVAEITKKTGEVVAAMMVTHDHDEAVITTKSGQMIKLPINSSSIPVLSRPTQGVILMRLKGGDKVVSVALTWKDIPEDASQEKAASK